MENSTDVSFTEQSVLNTGIKPQHALFHSGLAKVSSVTTRTVIGFFALVLFSPGLYTMPSVGGTPPCPMFDYSVTRIQSQWMVILYPYGRISFEDVFYSTNQMIDPLDPMAGPWEPLSPHLGKSPRVSEPVTLLDLDSSGNITSYDRLEILDETRSLSYVRIGFGRNETYVGGYQGITLEKNYWYICRNAGPTTPQDALTGGLALTAMVMTTIITTLAVYMRRHNSPRNSRSVLPNA